MFPCPIVEDQIETIPNYVINQIHEVDTFVVERAKTARRYLKRINHPLPMSEIRIIEMDKRDPFNIEEEFISTAKEKEQIGLLSEAGCPGIADPGAAYARKAYQLGFSVKPMVGPSSILMALMSSGMNGQNFSFVGYLPQHKQDLAKRIKSLEMIVRKTGQSQIFIETPYRNSGIIKALLDNLSANTYLCIAVDISGKSEYIRSQFVDQWRKTKLPEVHKRPAIFIIGK